MTMHKRKNRRTPNKCFLVFERVQDKFIGLVLNMSPEGIMLNSDKPVEVSKQYKCRMTLPEKISNLSQIQFDIECKWCQKNKKTDAYETGYQMVNVSEKDLKVINLLLRSWPLANTKNADLLSSLSSL
jgi:PilZ domain